MDEQSPALSRLLAVAKLGKDELLYLARAARRPQVIAPKSVIREEGATCSQCFVLLQGWAGSYTISADGRRIMAKVYMPGDMIGQTGLAYEEEAETVVALSEVTLIGIKHEAVGLLFATHPRLAAVLYMISQQERVQQADRTSALLRLGAPGRLAALLLSLCDRANQVSSGSRDKIQFPLTQVDIADLTGLTSNHTNRVLQSFRRNRLIELHRRTLLLLNRSSLEELVGLPRRHLVRDPSWLPQATS